MRHLFGHKSSSVAQTVLAMCVPLNSLVFIKKNISFGIIVINPSKNTQP